VHAGKAFFRKKRQPVPVDLRGSNWGAQIKRALGATYFFHTGGSCINLRRGARYEHRMQPHAAMGRACAAGRALREERGGCARCREARLGARHLRAPAGGRPCLPGQSASALLGAGLSSVS